MNKSYDMPKPCAIPKCKTGYRSVKEKYSVFRVPRNVEQYKKWQEAVPSVVLRQSQYVCEKHFEERYILRKWMKRDASGMIIAQSAYRHPRLDESAVPTIFESNETKQSTASVVHKYTDWPEDNVPNTMKILECPDISITGPSLMDVIDAESKHNMLHEAFVSQSFNRHENILPQSSIISPQKSVFPPVIIWPHQFVQHVVNPPQESIERDIFSEDDFVEHKVFSPIEATNNVSNIQDCAGSDSLVAVHGRKFEISNITINDRSTGIAISTENNEKCAITIPKSWGVAELSIGKGKRLVFSHYVMKRGNGIEVPVVEKSVMVDTDKTLRYYVYGRVVDPEGFRFAPILKDATLLPQTLEKFKNTSVCNGLGAINVHYLSFDSAFKDYVDRWRQNDCTLLSKRKRCDGCMKIRQRVLQREKRSKENRVVTRVFRAFNPTDQEKLVALQKKYYRERRLKNLAKRRGELLRQSLRDKADEIAFIRAQTLNEKCSSLNLPVKQKAALVKIISVASKNGTTNEN